MAEYHEVGQASRRLAILADIHGQLVALRAVLADIDAIGVDGIVVAGDMVGLGPCPAEVIDLLRERGAVMVQGNHERDYIGRFGAPDMPPEWAVGVRYHLRRWEVARLGPARHKFIADMPDRALIDEQTLVLHGSPRHIREGVTVNTSDAELAERHAGETARTVISGHTHKPILRWLDGRQFVNPGSAGLPLDGDPRAAFAIAERAAGDEPGAWRVSLRRVAYDIDAAVAAFDNGYADEMPEFAEMLCRSMRTGRDYFGPGIRAVRPVPDDEFRSALRHYLATLP